VKACVASGRQILQIFDKDRACDQEQSHCHPVLGISHGEGEAYDHIGKCPVDID
jgi:hypothetical protein